MEGTTNLPVSITIIALLKVWNVKVYKTREQQKQKTVVKVSYHFL